MPPPSETKPTTPAQQLESAADKLIVVRRQNHVSFESLKDRPLMREEDFNRINGALKESASPLFGLVARDLQTFWSSETNPPGFPSWIHEAITPLVVTYDTDQVSLVANESRFGNNMAFKLIDPSGKEIPYPLIEPVKMGIHLGSPIRSRRDGSLVEGLYLAKEYINGIALVSIAPQAVAVFNEMGYQFSTLDNQTLPKDLETQAGIAVFHNTTAHGQGNLWLAHDGLPIALVATQVEVLASVGAIPQKSENLYPFAVAANMFHENRYSSARDTIFRLVNEWGASGRMAPPDSYLRCMVDRDVFAFTKDLQKKIASTRFDTRVVLGREPIATSVKICKS